MSDDLDSTLEIKLAPNLETCIKNAENLLLLAMIPEEPYSFPDDYAKKELVVPNFNFYNIFKNPEFTRFFDYYKEQVPEKLFLGLSQKPHPDFELINFFKNYLANAKQLFDFSEEKFNVYFANIIKQDSSDIVAFSFFQGKKDYAPSIVKGSYLLSDDIKALFSPALDEYSEVKKGRDIENFEIQELGDTQLNIFKKELDDDESIPKAEEATKEDIEELDFAASDSDTNYLDVDVDISKLADSMKNDSERFMSKGLDDEVFKLRSSIVKKDSQETIKITKQEAENQKKPYSINISPKLEEMLLACEGYGFIFTESVEVSPKQKVFDYVSKKELPLNYKTLAACVLQNLITDKGVNICNTLIEAKESGEVPILYLTAKNCENKEEWGRVRTHIHKIYELGIKASKKFNMSSLNFFAYIFKDRLKFRNIVKKKDKNRRNKISYEVVPIPVEDSYVDPFASEEQKEDTAALMDLTLSESFRDVPSIKEFGEDTMDVQKRATNVLDNLLKEEAKKADKKQEITKDYLPPKEAESLKSVIGEAEIVDQDSSEIINAMETNAELKINPKIAEIYEKTADDFTAKIPNFEQEISDLDAVPIEVSLDKLIKRDTVKLIGSDEEIEIDLLLDNSYEKQEKYVDKKEKVEVKQMEKPEENKVQTEKLQAGSIVKTKDDLEKRVEAEAKSEDIEEVAEKVKKSRIKRLATWPFRKTFNYVKSVPKQLLQSVKWGAAAGLVAGASLLTLYLAGYDKEVKEGIGIGLENFENAAAALFDGEYLDDCFQILAGEESDSYIITKARKNLAQQSKKISELEEEVENFKNIKSGDITVYTKLRKNYNELEKTYNNLLKEKEIIVKERDSLSKTIIDCKKKFEDEFTKHKEEIKGLFEKQKTKYEKKLEDLTKNYKTEETAYKTQITNLNKKIGNLDSKISSLEKLKEGLVLTDENLKYFARTEYSFSKVRRLFKAVENKVDSDKFPKFVYAYALKELIDDKYAKRGLVKPKVLKTVLEKFKALNSNPDKTIEYFLKEFKSK